MSVEVSLVKRYELDWVNSIYAQIKFKESSEKDLILKITVDDVPAALGRLVPVSDESAKMGGIYVFPEFRGQKLAELIVSSLLEKSTYQTLWCIPFEPLESFYRKFGFRDVTTEKVPVEIREKVDWCVGRYPEKAILLVRTKS